MRMNSRMEALIDNFEHNRIIAPLYLVGIEERR